MSNYSYSCTALNGKNKVGTLKPDGNGYYDVVLGAVNVYNSRGEFYSAEPAVKLMEDGGILQRRWKNGNLRSEYGHPKFLPGMSKKDFLFRIMDTWEQCVCAHIKKVELDDSGSVKDEAGNSVIAFRGRIIPSGPFGDVLRRQLDNPDENVCFSIRSITDDVMEPSGRVVKRLREIYTWDYVNEPGISSAMKWNSPSLESLQEVQFRGEHLILASNMAKELGMGFESSLYQDMRDTIRNLDIPMVKDTKSGLVLPASMKW